MNDKSKMKDVVWEMIEYFELTDFLEKQEDGVVIVPRERIDVQASTVFSFIVSLDNNKNIFIKDFEIDINDKKFFASESSNPLGNDGIAQRVLNKIEPSGFNIYEKNKTLEEKERFKFCVTLNDLYKLKSSLISHKKLMPPN